MRDFFEDLGKRLGETAESLTNRASEVVEVQRIRGQIRALDRNNERDYRDIGRMIYEKYKNGEVIDTEMVCICEEIEKREATAEEMEQMIADSKGTTVCPNCHANLTPDMAVSYTHLDVNSTSSKNKDANKLGVKIISEDEFVQMLS